MKTLVCCIALLLCTLVGQAQSSNLISEDFNSLDKGKYGGNSEVILSLPSGDWQVSKMELKVNSGVKQFTFSSGSSSYLITPAVDDPGKITVDWGSGGNNKLTISYSVGNGPWQQLDQVSSGGSGAKSYGRKTGLDGLTSVRFRFVGSSSNTYVTKVVVQSASVVPVDPDDPTYITEGVWVPTKPFPAAKHTYYISPEGNDATGDGSEANPWYNIAVAYAAATAGDHIVCKGGTYKISKYGSDGKLVVRMDKKNTAAQPIVIRCADGEKPVFDFEQMLLDFKGDKSKVNGDMRGIMLTGDYHVIFGIHIKHAGDNGMKIEGSHNRIERCEFSYNLDTGLQLGFGHYFSNTGFGSNNDGSHCSYNDIIDCDSHHNCDYDANYGSDADGFACKMHNGKGNRFIRCRAWHNSDDAWDLYETDYDVILAECWAWESGKSDDHKWVLDYFTYKQGFSGNGNGIKMGGNGDGGNSKGIHYAFNCIAFGCNAGSSVKGFDCNSHHGGHVLVGCLAFDNSYDFMFESSGSSANRYYNNVCLGKQEICVGYDDYNALAAPMSKDGWTNHLVTGASANDYISLDEDDALLPRDIYGGMPRRFGRLTADPENVLTDAGNATLDDVNGVWQQLVEDFPFLQRTVTGAARDLGPYERPSSSLTAVRVPENHNAHSPRKYLQNGRLVIERDGHCYTPLGLQTH
jgi:hypothetical protein